MNWNRYAERAMWNYYKEPSKKKAAKAVGSGDLLDHW
jgi:hypothetical protein